MVNMVGPGYPYTLFDGNQVLRQSFDEASDSLRVSANVTANIGSVVLSALTSNIAIKDPVSTNVLKINADGSIDSNVILNQASDSVKSFIWDSNGAAITLGQKVAAESIPVVLPTGTTFSTTTTLEGAVDLSMQPLKTVYGESVIPQNTEVSVLIYTVTSGKTGYVQSVSVSGETIATYTLFHDADKFAVRRTSYGPGFDLTFDFTPSGAAGLKFNSGEQLIVRVLNNGPASGTFNANIQVIEV